jgi:hypothetical protein
VAENIQIVGLKQLQLKLARMGKDIGSVRMMGQIGAFVNLRIEERTARGVDKDDKHFTPYSAKYAKERSEAGHATSKPNLFFTGSMFSALTYNADKYKVTSYFMNTVDQFDARNSEKAFFNNETRPFFGLNDLDINEIEAIVSKHLNKLLKGK